MDFSHENIVFRFDICKKTIHNLLLCVGNDFSKVIITLSYGDALKADRLYHTELFEMVKNIFILNIGEWCEYPCPIYVEIMLNIFYL